MAQDQKIINQKNINNYFRNKQQSPTRRYRMNQFIRVPEVVVIDDNGEHLGVMPTSKALELAEAKELDLIEVSPLASPPVCRITDYGKFQYQQSRNQQKAKHHVKKVEIKGVRLSFKIGEHDLNIRRKQAEKFLEQGHKVRVEMRLRGREKAPAFREKTREVIQKFITGLQADVKVEKDMDQQGGTLTIMISKK